MVSTTFCGNERHNLIMICVKKYFLLFAVNLLPDHFLQSSVALVCDKELTLCLHKVLAVSSHTRAGTGLAHQAPSFYLSLSWEVCLGVESRIQPSVFMLKSTDKNSNPFSCYATWTLMHKELPWTHELISRRLLKGCLLKINSLLYWFELMSDWQLGEKFPILIQFSTYPKKKINFFILKLELLIFKKYTTYKMQATCQGTYLYELYIWISITSNCSV